MCEREYVRQLQKIRFRFIYFYFNNTIPRALTFQLVENTFIMIKIIAFKYQRWNCERVHIQFKDNKFAISVLAILTE